MKDLRLVIGSYENFACLPRGNVCLTNPEV